MTTSPHLGIRDLIDERLKVALVAPGDPSDPPPRTGPPLPDYLIVVHPALAQKEPAVNFNLPLDLQSASARECPNDLLEPNPGAEPYKLVQHRDPVGAENPDYVGDWLAAFAPVGRTGFVVIVQQRND